jgi:hypothetical protein
MAHVLSLTACEDLIATCERLGFGVYQAGKNHHGALQLIVPESICAAVARQIRPLVDPHGCCPNNNDEPRRSAAARDNNNNDQNSSAGWDDIVVNRRWRVYRYEPDAEQTFAPHIDAAFPPSGLASDAQPSMIQQDNDDDDDDDDKQKHKLSLVWDVSNGTMMSSYTVLLYLNDDFVGGATNFYHPRRQQQARVDDDDDQSSSPSKHSVCAAVVQPVAGSCLLFPQAVGETAVEYARQHWPLHEGSPVLAGARPKYVVRSDLFLSPRFSSSR